MLLSRLCLWRPLPDLFGSLLLGLQPQTAFYLLVVNMRVSQTKFDCLVSSLIETPLCMIVILAEANIIDIDNQFPNLYRSYVEDQRMETSAHFACRSRTTRPAASPSPLPVIANDKLTRKKQLLF